MRSPIQYFRRALTLFCLIMGLHGQSGLKAQTPALPVISVDQLPVDMARSADALFLAGQSNVAGLEIPSGGDWKAPGTFPAHYARYNGTVWLRVAIVNASEHEERLMAVHPYTKTDQVSFFLLDPEKAVVEQRQTDGALSRAGGRAIAYRTPAFEFSVPPHSRRTLVLGFADFGSLTLNTTVERASDFDREALGSYLVMGLFFGAVIVLVTYSISIYLAVQFRAMLDYALATAATAFFFLVRTGIYSQLIAPDDTWTAGGNGRRVVTGVVMFLVIRFSRSFLETREHHKILDVGLKTLQILSLGQAALGIVLADPLPQTVMSGIASIALLSVAGYLFYKKEAAGGLFLAGWLMPFSVVVLEVQADLGFSAFRPREELLQISVAAQFVLFALTLNHRFRSLTLERVKTVNRLETIEKDLNIARQIQARSLPPKIAQIPGVDVRVHYQPLHAVGGDFYDVVQLGSKILGIVVADVVGHGVSAAMDASTVRIAFRSSAPAGEDPSDVMRLMNKFLVPHLNGRFATACFALIDTDEMVVRMSAAGHPPVLLFRRSLGDVRILETPAHMLGLDPNAQFETREESIRPGDRLILYTDGIYDGPKAVPQNVGSSVLLRACMELMPMQSPGFDLALLKRMRELRGDPQVDDITFISVDIGESAGRSLPAASEHGAQTS